MNQHFSGEMISGELSPDNHEFTVTQIRHIAIQSVMDEHQLRDVYEFLSKAKNRGDDSIVVSAGSLPILMNQSEIEQLHQELHTILQSGVVH